MACHIPRWYQVLLNSDPKGLSHSVQADRLKGSSTLMTHMKLLNLQSSVRHDGSVSRSLSQAFIQIWQTEQAGAEILLRDVGQQPPSHPTALWTQANYRAPEERTPAMEVALQESDTLIEELLSSDRLVLGVPMYNFSVPGTLKAYIDNVVRINRTFAFNPETQQFRGLVTGKKAVIITPSAGNFVVGSPLGGLNFCDPYLRSLLSFIGITDITVVPVPNQFMDDPLRQQNIAKAKSELMALASHW